MSTSRNVRLYQDCWEDIAGNAQLKSQTQAIVRNMTSPVRGRGTNTLIKGDSRSGKTSTVALAIATIICRKPDLERLLPCGMCQPCLQNQGRYEHVNIDLLEQAGEHGDVNFVPIDGNNMSEKEIEEKLKLARGRSHLRWLFYIDEIRELVGKRLDHMLLVPIDMYRHITWIVTTATTKGLEPMFQNRFTVVQTQLPRISELGIALARWCRKPEMDVRWDDPKLLLQIAAKANCNPGLARAFINHAKLHGGRVTKELLDSYHFPDQK